MTDAGVHDLIRRSDVILGKARALLEKHTRTAEETRELIEWFEELAMTSEELIQKLRERAGLHHSVRGQ